MTMKVNLIKQETEAEQQCSQCRFRSQTLWRLHETEPETLTACSTCTLHLLKEKTEENNEITITTPPSHEP